MSPDTCHATWARPLLHASILSNCSGASGKREGLSLVRQGLPWPCVVNRQILRPAIAPRACQWPGSWSIPVTQCPAAVPRPRRRGSEAPESRSLRRPRRGRRPARRRGPATTRAHHSHDSRSSRWGAVASAPTDRPTSAAVVICAVGRKRAAVCLASRPITTPVNSEAVAR